MPVASVERYGSSERALERPFSHADNSAPTDFGSLYKTTDVRALPASAQYSRLSPAPYRALSAHESGNNIVDSIFSQSQIRHAPVSAPITVSFSDDLDLNKCPEALKSRRLQAKGTRMDLSYMTLI